MLVTPSGKEQRGACEQRSAWAGGPPRVYLAAASATQAHGEPADGRPSSSKLRGSGAGSMAFSPTTTKTVSSADIPGFYEKDFPGKVKSYCPENGYGFVTCLSLAKDVYFRRECLPIDWQRSSGLKGLPITFRLRPTLDERPQVQHDSIRPQKRGGSGANSAVAPGRAEKQGSGAVPVRMVLPASAEMPREVPRPSIAIPPPPPPRRSPPRPLAAEPHQAPQELMCAQEAAASEGAPTRGESDGGLPVDWPPLVAPVQAQARRCGKQAYIGAGLAPCSRF